MTDLQIKVQWSIAGGISALLIAILVLITPSLPAFHDLRRLDGTVELSTVADRFEGGEKQTLFMITLEGSASAVYVVMKGPDPGFYRATQTVAPGDDVTLWFYQVKQSPDLRVWQLSDRGMLIVDYNEVYGVEKRFRNEIFVATLVLLALANIVTYARIVQKTHMPPSPPMLEPGE